MVAQEYSQIEGIDFEETFAPVVRLKAIRLLLALLCLLKFNLYQMDVKSAFLNSIVQEEVYVEQSKGFIDAAYPDNVYRLKNALYALKQVRRAWYERLTIFLLKNGYARGGADNTLFVKKEKNQPMVAQNNVDDILFGGVSNQLMEDMIFISQAKYTKNNVKKLGLETAESKRIPIATHVKVTRDEDEKSVDISVYKNMIGSLLYLTESRPDIAHYVGV
ncbi:hypothetical protein LIER_16398 [Lithospermum erythrorhizon]|uniref:Reverse transcriptase Ty1/copia-type domain-containing protein n=1 Tax=Lithospermum erythrorhizon TaxID=34254 RepID=A0AAV3QAN2_LITER